MKRQANQAGFIRTMPRRRRRTILGFAGRHWQLVCQWPSTGRQAARATRISPHRPRHARRGRERSSAINAAGCVVGESVTADGHAHAFLYTASNGTMKDLGTLERRRKPRLWHQCARASRGRFGALGGRRTRFSLQRRHDDRPRHPRRRDGLRLSDQRRRRHRRLLDDRKRCLSRISLPKGRSDEGLGRLRQSRSQKLGLRCQCWRSRRRLLADRRWNRSRFSLQ